MNPVEHSEERDAGHPEEPDAGLSLIDVRQKAEQGGDGPDPTAEAMLQAAVSMCFDRIPIGNVRWRKYRYTFYNPALAEAVKGDPQFSDMISNDDLLTGNGTSLYTKKLKVASSLVEKHVWGGKLVTGGGVTEGFQGPDESMQNPNSGLSIQQPPARSHNWR